MSGGCHKPAELQEVICALNSEDGSKYQPDAAKCRTDTILGIDLDRRNESGRLRLMFRKLFPILSKLEAGELMALPIVALAVAGTAYGVTRFILGMPSPY